MKVALLAKGPTLDKFEGRDSFDEVWGLNQLGKTHELDRLFVMDDLVMRLPYYDGPEFSDWLKTYKGRIITSKQYDDWPTSEAYPIEEVSKFLGLPLGLAYYSTPDYMVATAIHEGADEIYLFGIDCIAPGMDQVRCSMAMWLGAAMSRGIRVVAPKGSAFTWWTNTGICLEQGLYGYVGRPRIESLVNHCVSRTTS